VPRCLPTLVNCREKQQPRSSTHPRVLRLPPRQFATKKKHHPRQLAQDSKARYGPKCTKHRAIQTPQTPPRVDPTVDSKPIPPPVAVLAGKPSRPTLKQPAPKLACRVIRPPQSYRFHCYRLPSGRANVYVVVQGGPRNRSSFSCSSFQSALFFAPLTHFSRHGRPFLKFKRPI